MADNLKNSIYNRRLFLEYLSVLGVSTAVFSGCAAEVSADEEITVEYLQAARYREIVIQKMNEVMKDVDVYIEMTWSTNWSTNVCGLPIVVVPCGFTSRGQPRSVTFVGKLYQEEKLMAVAKAFQDATDYHLKKPPEFS